MRIGIRFSIIAASIGLSGCASYLVVADEPRYAGQPFTENATSYAWGAGTSPHPGVVTRSCADGEQLAMVRVTRNFGQGLLSILSLGAVSPVTVTYHCATPPPPEGGEIDTSDAPGD